MEQRRLRSLVLLVFHECAAHGLNLDFLTKGRATNDEDEVDLFELTNGEGDELEEGSGRQLLNVVTIAAFNSTLLQLGK